MNKSILIAAIAALGLAFTAPASSETGGKLIVSEVSGKCLDVPGISNFTPGTPLQLWDCEVNGYEIGGKPSDQFWVFGQQGIIRNTLSGLCIDITGAVPGSQLQIAACNGSVSQVWFVRPDGFIQNQATGKCIDVQGAPNTGTPLQLIDCTFTQAQTLQRWRS
jgi:hypothetical protein